MVDDDFLNAAQLKLKEAGYDFGVMCGLDTGAMHPAGSDRVYAQWNAWLQIDTRDKPIHDQIEVTLHHTHSKPLARATPRGLLAARNADTNPPNVRCYWSLTACSAASKTWPTVHPSHVASRRAVRGLG